MKILVLSILIASFGIGVDRSMAQGVIPFGPREAKIIGSIPYSEIGQYIAQFTAFKGSIALGKDSQRVRSVYLEIDANSITSNCPWCDKIARSRRLLCTARYPRIIFRSDKIIHDEKGFKVRGFLEMHGIKRRMVFPFKYEIHVDQKTKRKILDLKGAWRINRKDFKIIWNQYLDRGGIVVGDYFTVNWGIREYINFEKGPPFIPAS